jgi:hypothetical protein
METCLHKSCGNEKKVWLPADNFGTDMLLHPWCIHCGIIKNISDDRGRKLGYWMNILSRIGNKYSLKQVQKRCIAKELTELEGFNDYYFIRGSTQKQIFTNIIKKYCKINENALKSYFY